MIRVANIIEDGRMAGSQIRIAEIARLLASKEVETTVIFSAYQSECFLKKLNEYGICNIRLPLNRLTRNKKLLLKYCFFFFYEIYLLRKCLKRGKYDIVHVSGGSWQYKGVIAGNLAGLKVVWHLNDTNMPALLRFFFKIIARRFTDGFIVAAERVRNYYLPHVGLDHLPVFEIQAPVATSKFDPATVQHNEVISNSEGIKIVTVGNVCSVKGLEYFIEMAAILNESFDNLNFYIIGPHYDSQISYSTMLKQMLVEKQLENVHFYGPCDNVAQALKSSDIYVCQSLFEASPISVWEAMSMAKAIISTDVGDVARFIKNGHNGFVVPTKDAAALAENTAILVNNADLRREFGDRARDTAKAYLDISIAVDNHIAAYKSILFDN